MTRREQKVEVNKRELKNINASFKLGYGNFAFKLTHPEHTSCITIILTIITTVISKDNGFRLKAICNWNQNY